MSLDHVLKKFNLQMPSPSPPVKRNSGLNGAIPSVWDSGWQLYTDLSTEQVAAFQAMPQWQTLVQSSNQTAQSPSPPVTSHKPVIVS